MRINSCTYIIYTHRICWCSCPFCSWGALYLGHFCHALSCRPQETATAQATLDSHLNFGHVGKFINLQVFHLRVAAHCYIRDVKLFVSVMDDQIWMHDDACWYNWMCTIYIYMNTWCIYIYIYICVDTLYPDQKVQVHKCAAWCLHICAL